MLRNQQKVTNLSCSQTIFRHGGEKWSGEQPILFSFHMLECWRANQVALCK